MTKRYPVILAAVALAAAAAIVIVVILGDRGREDTAKSDRETRLERLRAVPYTNVTDGKVAGGAGVLLHDPDEAFTGYNLYASRVASEAYLMDMDGNVVHTWSYPREKPRIWELAVILDGGDLLVIEELRGLLMLDWDSNLIWERSHSAHHDIRQLEDGTYYMVCLEVHRHRGMAVRFPCIVRLDSAGETIDKWSGWEHLDQLTAALDTRSFLDTILDSIGTPDSLPDRIRGAQRVGRRRTGGRWYDYFHANTIMVLPDTPVGRQDPRFKAGNLLTCFRNVNQVVALEGDSKEIVWAWGEGELEWPHHPTMLENGSILLFDNGRFRGYSRVLEVNPLTEEIEWEYVADPPESFYSNIYGSAQRLPNGNTLVCDGAQGRAFEVTRGGRIVWEWLNPETKNGHRAQIYRMMRYAPEIVESLLAADHS